MTEDKKLEITAESEAAARAEADLETNAALDKETKDRMAEDGKLATATSWVSAVAVALFDNEKDVSSQACSLCYPTSSRERTRLEKGGTRRQLAHYHVIFAIHVVRLSWLRA